MQRAGQRRMHPGDIRFTSSAYLGYEVNVGESIVKEGLCG